ncbi:hypothetical protein GCM10022221_79800 [Actinocorallia aurea]
MWRKTASATAVLALCSVSACASPAAEQPEQPEATASATATPSPTAPLIEPWPVPAKEVEGWTTLIRTGVRTGDALLGPVRVTEKWISYRFSCRGEGMINLVDRTRENTRHSKISKIEKTGMPCSDTPLRAQLRVNSPAHSTMGKTMQRGTVMFGVEAPPGARWVLRLDEGPAWR